MLPLTCTNWAHDAGTTAFGWLRNIGLRPSRRLVEIWESYGSLADAEARTAFVHTLRSVVDQSGQRVSANDRLYLAAHAPTLVVWGAKDAIIPVQQAYDAHAALPGAGSRSSTTAATSRTAKNRNASSTCSPTSSTSTEPGALDESEWREVLRAATR